MHLFRIGGQRHCLAPHLGPDARQLGHHLRGIPGLCKVKQRHLSQSFGELSRLYQTSELLDVSYEDELVLSLRGREKDVARLSKRAKDGPAE